MLVTMKEILDRACAEGYAVAAPNVGNSLEVDAAIKAAEDLNAPLILDVHLDRPEDRMPCAREFGLWMRLRCMLAKVPIAINEDHGASYFTAVKNIQNGVTSVMADRSSLPYAENVAEVKKVVELAHNAGVSVEAELGHVGDASTFANVSDEGTGGDSVLTNVEEAVNFIKETGVDCLAISIGTAHGAWPKGVVPKLDFDRLAEIKAAVDKEFGQFPLVLHGSSETPDEQLYKACRMGINKVNIATDLNNAAMKAVLESNGDGNAFKLASQGFCDKLKKMIPIYGSDGKAWK